MYTAIMSRLIKVNALNMIEWLPEEGFMVLTA
jgi:hypothetical protein